jgi:hypothetical protein
VGSQTFRGRRQLTDFFFVQIGFSFGFFILE